VLAKVPAQQGIRPAGTANTLVQKINTDLRKVVAMPDVIARFQQLGTDSRDLTPAQINTFIRSEEQVAGRARAQALILGARRPALGFSRRLSTAAYDRICSARALQVASALRPSCQRFQTANEFPITAPAGKRARICIFPCFFKFPGAVKCARAARFRLRT
jgi:hypothetical protein